MLDFSAADRTFPWREARVLVGGAEGFAYADALLECGARVFVDSASVNSEQAKILTTLDAVIVESFGEYDLVIDCGGFDASVPGVPVWSDAELAWRLMHPDRVVPWLGVAWAPGALELCAAILQAGGYRPALLGTGRPIIEAINDPQDYDVFLVALTPDQLAHSPSLSLHSACALTTDGAGIYNQVQFSAIYNADDATGEEMVAEAEVVEGARAIGFTRGIPAVSMLGVVDDQLVDRAFIEQRRTSALPLAQVDDLDLELSDVLLAAALGRSFGVKPTAVATGIKNYGGERDE